MELSFMCSLNFYNSHLKFYFRCFVIVYTKQWNHRSDSIARSIILLCYQFCFSAGLLDCLLSCFGVFISSDVHTCF